MEHFNLKHSLEILERTPHVLEQMLSGLSDEWIHTKEGSDTWSPYDIVGHLIHGEKTDWMTRLDIILSDKEDKSFAPFDRFAQYEESKGKSAGELLITFRSLRSENLKRLKRLHLGPDVFECQGIHPAFGPVTLSELLSTWVVHDLNHIHQITRVMARRYQSDVGPWKAYLKILSI